MFLEVNEPHEGLRKNESQWPIHQLNWQKSRYIYDLYYTYNRISKEVYDYCIVNKIIDASLIAKWKKPGYERLCSTYVINPRNYNFGTVSICRVPKQCLAPGTEIEDPTTGCRGCASGSSSNIFGNKYGQYLAAIQVAREERIAQRKAIEKQQLEENENCNNDSENEENQAESSEDDNENSDESDNEDKSDLGPVGAADGGCGEASNRGAIWAASSAEEETVSLAEGMIGQLAPEAKREAMLAMSKASNSINSKGKQPAAASSSGPPGKRSKQY